MRKKFKQLFDDDNALNKQFGNYLFTTEGHILPIGARLRSKVWTHDETSSPSFDTKDASNYGSDLLFYNSFKTSYVQLKGNITQPSVSRCLWSTLLYVTPYRY